MTRIEAVRRLLADRFHQRPEITGLVVGRQRDQELGGGDFGRGGWIGHGRRFPCRGYRACRQRADRTAASRPERSLSPAGGSRQGGSFGRNGADRTRITPEVKPGDDARGEEIGQRCDARESGNARGGEKQVPTPEGPTGPAGCRPAQVDRSWRPPREEGRREHQDLAKTTPARQGNQQRPARRAVAVHEPLRNFRPVTTRFINPFPRICLGRDESSGVTRSSGPTRWTEGLTKGRWALWFSAATSLRSANVHRPILSWMRVTVSRLTSKPNRAKKSCAASAANSRGRAISSVWETSRAMIPVCHLGDIGTAETELIVILDGSPLELLQADLDMHGCGTGGCTSQTCGEFGKISTNE